MKFTPDLFEQFQKRWHYDLKANLPSLPAATPPGTGYQQLPYRLMEEFQVVRLR